MKRTLVNLLLISILVFAVSPGAQAQGNKPQSISHPKTSLVTESDNGIYIIQMVNDPVVAYSGGVPGLRATKPARGEKIDPDSPKISEYVAYLNDRHNAALNSVGGQIIYHYNYSYNGFAASMSLDQANLLTAVEGVLAVTEDELVTSTTSTTPDFLGLTAEGGLWEMDVTGEDIIIGVIDSGIWPESLSFSDRTYTNPNDKDGKLGYQQIPGWHGKCVPGESFDASMCNQKLIGAQYFNAGWGGDAGIDQSFPWEFNSPRDYDGHGTHTTSTAGGNRNVPAEIDGIPFGAINGMAPRARISVYKTFWSVIPGPGPTFTLARFSDTVAAIDQAVADGVDVINYSASSISDHFFSPIGIAYLYAADAGVFVAAAGGNEGPALSTVDNISPWVTTVAAGTHDRFYAGTVLLGNGSVYYGASIDSRGAGPADLVYARDVAATGVNADDARRCFPGSLDPALADGKIILCDRGDIARVTKSAEVARAGGIGMVHANIDSNSLNADFHSVPTVHVDHIAGAAIRSYTQTTGATATLTGGIYQTAEAPEVASLSSRGPTLASGDLLKPDILAPGIDVLAAVAPPANFGQNFGFYSGTSMASPHIAGVAALIMDAHPDWSPMMVKSALMTTASTETNLGNRIPGNPFDFGAGLVNPNAAIDPGLVYDAGFSDWLAFLCGTGELQAYYCPSIAIDPSNLNSPSISIGGLAGSQTITRWVKNVGAAGIYQVTVSPLPGIDVIVSPSSLSLDEGESASYEVTFIVKSDAIPETWQFGTLTWSDGTHQVTSPLAIYVSGIAVPDELHLSGTSGSERFSIGFGYNGDYAAGNHGLSPAYTQSSMVADDPFNSYLKARRTCDFDGGFPYSCDGITWHRFIVPDDSLYVQISLFDDYTDGADDLDLYVYYDSFLAKTDLLRAGTSDSPTSTEEISLVNPPAGTYEIAVHGWDTDGRDASYMLFSWAIGPDLGNMSIEAPSSAAVGTIGTVSLNWSGLELGTKYLGAISHSDGDSLLDLTLLRVATERP